MNPSASASESSDTPMSAARGDDIEQQEHPFQDEDERSDAASPSLHGLEKELSSTRANFTEYLKAQRSLQSRRCVYSSIAQIKTAAPAAPLTPEVGRDGSTRKRTCVAANSTYMASASANKQPQRTEEEEKTILRLGLLGRRSSTANVMATNDSAAAISNAIAWDKVFHELEAIDEDGHFHDGYDHVIPFYSPPVQRQRWGHDQILPHVNWGDLFFDLFYVAAAYNLGVMLTSAANPKDRLRGIIYYIGAFGAMWTMWETSMFYESRYVSVDYAHRLFEVIRFLCVSLAVLHIKPIELFGDPKSSEILLFTFAIVLEALMHLALNCELYFKGQGDRAAIENHTLVKIKHQLLPTLLVYIAAFIVAAILYFGPDDSYSRRWLGSDADAGISYSDQPLWTLSDLPLTLTAIAYLQNIIATTWRKMRATNGKHGDIRQLFVPNNVDYVIHRYGEWCLLMIGEGILSLLIVETTESKDYYVITTFGILSIIFIQILKFESEPSHAEGHALWRNLLNAMCYGYLIQVLSMALIAFGVSYKVFLKNILKESEPDDGNDEGRFLASSIKMSDEATAALFTGSLSFVIASLEIMVGTHGGLKHALNQFFSKSNTKNDGESAPRVLNRPIVLIFVFKVGLFLFTVTLNQWTEQPAVLTLCGFGIVSSLALTRVLNWAFIHKHAMIDSAAKNVVTTVQNIKHAVLFAPSISDTGEEALAWTSNPSTADGEKRSVSGSTSSGTSGTDLASGIDNTFDAIVISDLNGIIKRVNATAVEMFGYATHLEMLGKNLSIIVGGGEDRRHDAYLKAFKRRVGTASASSSKVLGQQRMLHARRADGTEFPCIIGIKLCANDTRIVGYIRDMSGVVSGEKSKLTAKMQVEKAIDSVADDHAFDAIIVSDDTGKIHRVNQRAVTELGYESKDDMVGENISTLIHGLIDHLEELMESHGEQRVVTLTKKDGKEFQSIIATTKITGTSNMVASYIRNVDLVSESFKCETCDRQRV